MKSRGAPVARGNTTVTKKRPTAQIRRLALQIEAHMHRAEKEDIFKPRRGSIMEQLWKGGMLTYQQQRAWTQLIRLVQDAKGKSGPVVSSYSEAIDGGGAGGMSVPDAYENDSHVELTLLGTKLSAKERAILHDLLFDELTRPGSVGLGRIGFYFSGYKNEAQARAAGTAAIQYVCDRLGTVIWVR